MKILRRREVSSPPSPTQILICKLDTAHLLLPLLQFSLSFRRLVQCAELLLAENYNEHVGNFVQFCSGGLQGRSLSVPSKVFQTANPTPSLLITSCFPFATFHSQRKFRSSNNMVLLQTKGILVGGKHNLQNQKVPF